MKFPAQQVKMRFLLIIGIILVVAVAILCKIVYTMTVEKEFWMQVQQRVIKEGQVLPAKRGNILSDDGTVLAASVPEFKVFIDYVYVDKNKRQQIKGQRKRDSIFLAKIDSISTGLHRIIPQVTAEEMKRNLLEGFHKKARHWAIYKNRISYVNYEDIKRLPFFNIGPNTSGLHHEQFTTRTNPYGRLAIRTIGDVYKGKDEARSGLELGLDSILRGTNGTQRVEKVRSSKVPIVTQPAIDGLDVKSTLNVTKQEIVEKALQDQLRLNGANYGLCILMEVATGDVKAISTLTLSNGVYQEVDNKAVSQLSEPGSVFKPVSFLAAMTDGRVRFDNTFDTGSGIKIMYGRRMRDASWQHGGAGLITVSQILEKSSNVGTSGLIDAAYHNDPERFVDAVYRTGINEDLRLPLPGYAKPKIRRPNADKSNWSNTALPWMSIGYETTIPPISTLTFYNGLANNGRMVRPRFYTAVMKDGEVVSEVPVQVIREQMGNPQAVADIRSALEKVVVKGTGKKAASRYFKVAGKTGTAQIWSKEGFRGQYLVSFAGFFPADKPQYSMIVCFQGPGLTSSASAATFKQVAENVMALNPRYDYITVRDSSNILLPTVSAGNLRMASRVLESLRLSFLSDGTERNGNVWGTGHTNAKELRLIRQLGAENEVPDMRNYGLRDALFRLEKMGLRVRANGYGLVTAQSLPPGHKFRRGETIELTLGNAKADSLKIKHTATEGKAVTTATPPPAKAVGGTASAPKPTPAPTKKKEPVKAAQKPETPKKKAQPEKPKPKSKNKPAQKPKKQPQSALTTAVKKAEKAYKKNYGSDGR